MKLPVQTALSVGYWRDVVDDRLPVHRFSPQNCLHPDIQVGPRVNKHFHCRPAVVKDAIHRVKDGGVPSSAIRSLIGSGVYVSTVLQQDAGTTDRVELCADVQSRNAPTGREGAQGVECSFQHLSRCGQQSAKCGIVIKENRLEQRIAYRRTRIKQYL
jgi:hypothetical protein